MEKAINKARLDDLIGMIRAYLHSDVSDVKQMKNKCETIIAFAAKHFPNAMRIIDLIQTILAYGGFKPNAENEDIYKVLEVLGWGVECNAEIK